MTLLIGSFTIGLILSLLSFGILVSFRIFDFPDITTEGSFTAGAAVTATLLIKGVNPFIATFIGMMFGILAGITTGLLHTRFKINGLLSGILVMTALYSINLHTMGKSNIPLLKERTLATMAEQLGMTIFGSKTSFFILGWEITIRDASILILAWLGIIITGLLLYWFFRTNLGTAMRSTGDNDQMISALGVNVSTMRILGLGLSNGLTALSGSLLSQYQGFADVQMGIGMLIWGLASVIIGEALVSSHQLSHKIMGVAMGSVLFRLLVAIALRIGLNPNDLKLITAIFVFGALIFPHLLEKMRENMHKETESFS